MRVCPKCKKEYNERPAISRIDGSEICPLCGTKEALDEAVKYGMLRQDVADENLKAIEELDLNKKRQG